MIVGENKKDEDLTLMFVNKNNKLTYVLQVKMMQLN
jgi:hypothetical protein